MSAFKKKPDPISERAKALQSEIASIKSQIRKLEAQQPKPEAIGSAAPESAPAPAFSSTLASEPPRGAENGFEDLKPASLDLAAATESTDGHYNELGVRKYDLASAWEKLKNQFRGPAASNPKLVSYLATGSVRGLRPLRYEKRVARNRFLVLLFLLIAILWGLVVALFQNS